MERTYGGLQIHTPGTCGVELSLGKIIIIIEK